MSGVNTDKITQILRVTENGLAISREEYDRRVRHEYAGPGTPSDPSAPGIWIIAQDDNGATCLWTGIRLPA
jgi:hypothetical protein